MDATSPIAPPHDLDVIHAKIDSLATTTALTLRAEQVMRRLKDLEGRNEGLDLVRRFVELLSENNVETPYFQLDALAGFIARVGFLLNAGLSSKSASERLLIKRSERLADATVLDILAATARPIERRADLSCPAHAIRACAMLGARELGTPVRSLVAAAKEASLIALGAAVTIEAGSCRVRVDAFGDVAVERRTIAGDFVAWTDTEAQP